MDSTPRGCAPSPTDASARAGRLRRRRTARSARIPLLSAALFVALTPCAPAAASPEDPAFVLSIVGCGDLDRAELLRLLELELVDVAPSFRARGAPPVELACVGSRVTIRIGDPVTGKTVARTLPRPIAQGAERTVALAVSQLFSASWLELLVPEPARPPLPDRPETERAAATRIARDVLPESPAPAAPPAANTTARIWTTGALGLRDLPSPLGTGRAGLFIAVAPSDDWAVVAGATLEHGSAGRQRGDVAVWIASAEIGVAAPVLRAGDFRLWLGGRAGVLWGRLRGESTGPGVRADAIEDVGGRAIGSLRPELRLGPAILSLELEIGVDLHLPQGRVTDEPDVAPSGPFGSLGLGVGFVF